MYNYIYMCILHIFVRCGAAWRCSGIFRQVHRRNVLLQYIRLRFYIPRCLRIHESLSPIRHHPVSFVGFTDTNFCVKTSVADFSSFAACAFPNRYHPFLIICSSICPISASVKTTNSNALLFGISSEVSFSSEIAIEAERFSMHVQERPRP